jgi:hypothetical protein
MKSINYESGRFDKFLGAIASLIAILTFFGVTGVGDLKPQLARLTSKLGVIGSSPSSSVKAYLSSRFGGEAQTAWGLLGTQARKDDWEGDFDTFKAAVQRDSACEWELHDIHDVHGDELSAEVYVHRTVASGATCDKVSTGALIYRLTRRDQESAWTIVGASRTGVRGPDESALVKTVRRLLSPRKDTGHGEFSPGQVLAQLRQLHHGSEKMEFLRISRRGFQEELSVQFLEMVLKEFNFDSERLAALKLLRPYTAKPAPQNITAITELFVFGNYKIEALKVLQ